MLDQHHVDYDTYAPSLGFSPTSDFSELDDEYCNPTSDITELENNIISTARSAEAYNTPSQKSEQIPSQKPAQKQGQKQSISEKTLSMPRLDDGSVTKKKRTLKRKISPYATSCQQHTDDTNKNNTNATDMCGVENSANAANAAFGQNHSTISTDSSETEGTTLQPLSFEEYKLKIVNCNLVLNTVSMLAYTTDKPLRKHTDVCAKELKAMLEHYKACIESTCCFLCKKSPKTNPLRVKSVKCGHSFSCFKCFVTHYSSSNGQLQCARCGQLSPVIIE